jgi:hypothetical protein
VPFAVCPEDSPTLTHETYGAERIPRGLTFLGGRRRLDREPNQVTARPWREAVIASRFSWREGRR